VSVLSAYIIVTLLALQNPTPSDPGRWGTTAPGISPEPQLAYLITTATTGRAGPSLKSDPVATLPPFSLLRLERMFDGWACGTFSTNDIKMTRDHGCVPMITDNILPLDTWDAAQKVVAVKSAGWPRPIAFDILRGKVKLGFSEAQVKAAAGDPANKTESETAAGTKQLWAYPSRTIIFTNGRVSEVVTQK
jgi:hypothetical protein